MPALYTGFPYTYTGIQVTESLIQDLFSHKAMEIYGKAHSMDGHQLFCLRVGLHGRLKTGWTKGWHTYWTPMQKYHSTLDGLIHHLFFHKL